MVLTSNRTRDLHDALKRRCLYHWIEYPDTSGSRRSSGGGCPRLGRCSPHRWPMGWPGCATWIWPSHRALRRRSAGRRRWVCSGRTAWTARRPRRPPVRCSSTPRICRRSVRPGSPRWRPVSLTGPMAAAPLTDDLALTAARFGTALRAAGMPADPGRCERFARAVTVARPATAAPSTCARSPPWSRAGIRSRRCGGCSMLLRRRARPAPAGSGRPAPRLPAQACGRGGHPGTCGHAARPHAITADSPAGRSRPRPARTATGEPKHRSRPRARTWPARRNGWPARTSPSSPRPSCSCCPASCAS